jgi:hypothetical protein
VLQKDFHPTHDGFVYQNTQYLDFVAIGSDPSSSAILSIQTSVKVSLTDTVETFLSPANINLFGGTTAYASLSKYNTMFPGSVIVNVNIQYESDPLEVVFQDGISSFTVLNKHRPLFLWRPPYTKVACTFL